jgi:hypothetical protein
MTKGQSKPTAAERTAQRKANQHARDQFAALGLFIQNFEGVVTTLRNHSARMVMGADRGAQIDTTRILTHWNICSLVFHHESMTARPILDLWRAILFEQCKTLPNLPDASRKTIEAISKEIAAEFQKIIDIRNRLIHASWRIGYWVPTFHELENVVVEKYRVGVDGFTRRQDLPSSFDELMENAKRAARCHAKLARFLQYFQYHPNEMDRFFVREKNEWVFNPPQTQKTSRQKSR